MEAKARGQRERVSASKFEYVCTLSFSPVLCFSCYVSPISYGLYLAGVLSQTAWERVLRDVSLERGQHGD